MEYGEFYVYPQGEPISLKDATPRQVIDWAEESYPWTKEVLQLKEEDIATLPKKQVFVATLTNVLACLKLVRSEKKS